MTVLGLQKATLKLILQTSQGFPVQRAGALVKVKQDPATGARSVAPKPLGHPISAHVRGASAMPDASKTRFASLDDQVEALWLLLQTPSGAQALANLGAGTRQAVEAMLPTAFAVLAPKGGGTRTFTTAEQASVGIGRTRCVAVLEGRERAGRLYLHVQTCFPKFSASELGQLQAL